MGVKVLSLFDGMGCAYLAMQAAGIKVDRYVAYEIDKYAVKTSSHNFPMIDHRGDVFQADFTEFRGFDFVVGGSPCTYWSIAQKNNRETEASGMGWELFCQYVRAVKEAQPMYFIYENNKSMSKAIRESITETFGFEPICINSALVSAQNRQRLYWVGKRNLDGTYSKVHVDQPEDRGILLRDVLDGVTDREKGRCVLSSTGRTTHREYFQKNQGNMTFEPVAEPFGETNGKAYALTASYYKGQPHNKILEKSQRTHVAEPVGIGYRGRMEDGKWVKRYESNEQPKANALTTVQTDSMVAQPVRIPEYGTVDKARPLGANYSNNCGGFEHRMFSDKPNKQQVDMVAQPVTDPIRIGCYPSPDGTLKNSQGMRLYSVDGKSVNMTSQGGGLGAKSGLYAFEVPMYAQPIEWDENGRPTKAISGADGKTYPVYQVKDGYITIKDKQYPIKLADGFYIIRKLTVSECKRLQTVPEWYEFPVSDTQAYKMLGNGWTVLVISWLIQATQADVQEEEQLSFFNMGVI